MNHFKKSALTLAAAVMLTINGMEIIPGTTDNIIPLTASAASVIASGECGAQGDNLVWQFDSDGKLTINGTGEMADWDFDMPWNDYIFDILTVEIKSGVTSIGDMSFNNCTDMTSISIPDSVTSIGEGVFFDCHSLGSIEIPDGIKALEFSTFYDCTSLTSVTLPESIEELKYGVFQNCEKLTSLTIKNPDCKIYDYKTTICNSYNYETEEAVFNGTIYGYAGSTAQAYAEKYNRKFAVISGDSPAAVQGDVNNDSKIDSADASLVLAEYGLIQTNGTLTFTDIQKKSADVTTDSKLDSADASKILEYYAAVSTGQTPSWD
ncbi:MAG: leucine-rich repeat protein [Ruminococcus sp.]|nr:leucine-rich repeat protein [Ruminococcus sp.]